MQVSKSLADFLSTLDVGPRGVPDAIVAIQQCAESQTDQLDLQQMCLTDADLQSIIPRLASVAHITKLNLFMNEFTTLPAPLNTLSNLQELHAGANPLKSIAPELLRALPKLRVLDVGYSETLEQLPDAFEGTPGLRVLMAGNSLLADLPESLFTCSKLVELHAYGNCLKSLSASIGKLQHLRVLNVGRNQIVELPSQLAECRSLATLHAYENCLQALPPGVGSLPMLSDLNVRANIGLPTPPVAVRAQASAKATATFLGNS